ncbi:MAG: zinc dependent phospholipase C family protein [Acidobacteriia bacterium]|nr:zinc dependent phospholipase C family protein [Terriglobia bacterium]
MRIVKRHFEWSLALIVFVSLCSPLTSGYSVLTHEQVVDLMWKDQIQPLLLKRFQDATEQDLQKAHAYAYGGCVLQDMGYYPFGNKFFSDLVHYVRSGDFVEALLQDSSDLNEYAFALGALSHYASDNSGHPTINRVVALEFPKLRKKYGDIVTYADDPKAHIRTEFGFDMVQVAKNRYTSDRYHDLIGFEVSKPLLERAFFETYGLKLEDVFGNVDLAIGSYRRSVSVLIPEMTRVALLSRHDVIVKDTPNFNKRQFLYHLSRSNYEHEWGTVYRKPGIGSRILAFFLKLIPKVGPFKAVNFKIPTQQTEDMYIKSVNDTVENYTLLLSQAGNPKLELPNRDCDTGRETRAGEYALTDKTYASLIDKLAGKNSGPISPALEENLVQFYSDRNAPNATRKDAKAWRKLQDELEQLKQRTAMPSTERPPVLNQ